MPAQNLGLRDRKKMKIRKLLQHYALQLFSEQGYDNVTVDQIVELAEVSPSTFFRYFPTKGDVILYDLFDQAFMEELNSQLLTEKPLSAIRNAILISFASIRAEDIEEMRVRDKLIREVPELRCRIIDDIFETFRTMVKIIAEQEGRSEDDFKVRTLVGAVLGAMGCVWLTANESSGLNLSNQINKVFELLQNLNL